MFVCPGKGDGGGRARGVDAANGASVRPWASCTGCK